MNYIDYGKQAYQKQIRVSPSLKYQFIKALGCGSYGKVIKVKNTLTHIYHAVKKINLLTHNKADNIYLINELKILSFNNCKYLLRADEIYLDNNDLCIVTECCNYGDLRQFIRRYKTRSLPIPEEKIWYIFLQICLGIDYLHSHNIIHRDLKTANILINRDFSIMIGDFGVSKILKPSFNLAETRIGTPYYVSPEIVRGKKYDKKIDIWALGCILCELMTLDYAFLSKNIHALNYKILEGKYELNKCYYSDTLVNLVKTMLNPNIEKRPDIIDLLLRPEIKDKLLSGKYSLRSDYDANNKDLNRYVKNPISNLDWSMVISDFNKGLVFNSPRPKRPRSGSSKGSVLLPALNLPPTKRNNQLIRKKFFLPPLKI